MALSKPNGSGITRGGNAGTSMEKRFVTIVAKHWTGQSFAGGKQGICLGCNSYLLISFQMMVLCVCWCFIQDSKGNRSSIKSAAIEAEYQRNKKGSHQFTVGSDRFEIRFRGLYTLLNCSYFKIQDLRRILSHSQEKSGLQ